MIGELRVRSGLRLSSTLGGKEPWGTWGAFSAPNGFNLGVIDDLFENARFTMAL